MTIEQMNLEIRSIERTAQEHKEYVYKKYALENNPYKIGDIIEDNYHRIQIQIIKTTVVNHKPSCVYEGIQLKRDNTPFKRQGDTRMYQLNVERQIK